MVWEEQLGETSKGDVCWERKKCRAKILVGLCGNGDSS